MFAVNLLTPAYLPRYGLPMACITIVGAMWTLSQVRWRARLPYGLVLLGLCMPGAKVSTDYIRHSMRWIESQLGGNVWKTERNSFVHTRHPLGPEYYASPDMIRFIRANSGPGDVLVYNVFTFMTPLWNGHYTNKLVFLPGWPDEEPQVLGDPTPEQLSDWLARLRDIGPRHILVYSGSAYARELRRGALPECQVAFEDPATRGPGPMILFECATPSAASRPARTAGE
jgi:hypothetical protein